MAPAAAAAVASRGGGGGSPSEEDDEQDEGGGANKGAGAKWVHDSSLNNPSWQAETWRVARYKGPCFANKQ